MSLWLDAAFLLLDNTQSPSYITVYLSIRLWRGHFAFTLRQFLHAGFEWPHIFSCAGNIPRSAISGLCEKIVLNSVRMASVEALQSSCPLKHPPQLFLPGFGFQLFAPGCSGQHVSL